jgi:hypothetical protein
MLTPLELMRAAAHMRQRIADTTDRVIQRGCMEAADMLEAEAGRLQAAEARRAITCRFCNLPIMAAGVTWYASGARETCQGDGRLDADGRPQRHEPKIFAP